MLVEENAINYIVARNPMNRQTTTYTKVNEHSRNTKTHELNFVEYSYKVGDNKFTTCVHCNELWNLLGFTENVTADVF